MRTTKACPICRSHLGEDKAKVAIEHLKEKSRKAPEETVSNLFSENLSTISDIIAHTSAWNRFLYFVDC